MENVNIISEENEVKSNWLQLKAVGDEFQGTLVDKHNSVDNYNNAQIVYEFLMEDGQLRPYGTSKEPINIQMKNVKFGQIVGMKFVRQDPPKVKGYNPTNVIQVFANPNVVNKEWLEEQEMDKIEGNEQSLEQVAEGMPDAEVPMPIPVGGVTVPAPGAPIQAPAPVTADPVETADPVAQINALAKSKLLINDVNLVKDGVQQVTGFAFIEMNYQKIVDALVALPNK